MFVMVIRGSQYESAETAKGHVFFNNAICLDYLPMRKMLDFPNKYKILFVKKNFMLIVGKMLDFRAKQD